MAVALSINVLVHWEINNDYIAHSRATYLAGEFLCSQNDMVRLSAILCQIIKGDYVTHR